MKKDLFEIATKNSKKKDSEIPVVTTEDPMEQIDLFNLIKEFDEKDKDVKKLTIDTNRIKDKLRDFALNKYFDKYQEDENNPGSILVEVEKDLEIAQYLFVPQDRYISIKSEKDADLLTKKYGNDIIERNMIYSIDPTMFKKYSKVLSELIENSDDIEHEDKGKMFVSNETYSIKEGLIDNLNLFENYNIKDIFEDVRPVVAIKNIKVIKS